ncbi:hypothetical protein DUNSADRAFT_6285 [Dunaliella salina]|uniref:Uncharacterized protein n=1 Tax=Dunaliella salina TaxID=3046 RepID=A0ABQ7GNM0_DUNSA|nr:hypothetical protein DUNSADRAFT_6285 [Dunaliella salina]|eukprot:KAF5836176.1 hypothetical protein DUNSADRAFT_6285 [Dunaliella salina]
MGKMTIFAVAFLAGLMQMSASELAKVHDPSPSTTPSNEDSTSLGKVAVTLQVTMGSNEYTPVIFGKQLVAVESIFKELIEEDPNVFVNSIGMVARHIGENFPDRLPGFIEAKAFVFVRGTQGDVAAKNSVAEFFATLKNSTSDGDGVVKALNDRMVELLGELRYD